MKRREFITLLVGAAAWPLAARAQQAGKLPIIGLLGSATLLAESQRVAAFVQRLRQLGWIENRNVAIEYRWAEGRSERFVEIATEFVQLKVDVIVATTTPATIAAKQATSVIPIVFTNANDPVGLGLVASLARPGGNVTGLSNQLRGHCFQAPRTFAGGCPGSATVGDLSQCRQSWIYAGNARGSGNGPYAQPRSRHLGNPASRGYRARLRRGQRPRGCALCRCRPACKQQSRSHQHLGAGRTIANDARCSGLRRSGWPDVLWTKHRGRVSTRRRLCRQDFAWRKARRHPGRAADQVRFHHKPYDRKGARPRSTADAARPRRRGDRIAVLLHFRGNAALRWLSERSCVARPGLRKPPAAERARRGTGVWLAGVVSRRGHSPACPRPRRPMVSKAG